MVELGRMGNVSRDGTHNSGRVGHNSSGGASPVGPGAEESAATDFTVVVVVLVQAGVVVDGPWSFVVACGLFMVVALVKL